jgi:ribosomal protein S12 methylthiotransferase accessory factor
MERPAFRSLYRVDIPDDDTIALSSERDPIVLEGPGIGRIAGLVNGSRTDDAIARRARGYIDPASVHFVLHQLREQGYLVAAGQIEPPCPAPATRLLARLLPPARGRTPGPAACRVVPTADYLDPRLRRVNRRALRDRRPWVVIQPHGAVVWVGPLFQPGHGPCWECLAHRLRGHRPLDAWLARTHGHWPPPVPRPSAPGATALVTDHVMQHVAGHSATWNTPLRAHLLALDLATGTAAWHRVARRPQCPACGDGRAARHPALIDDVTGIVRRVQGIEPSRWPSIRLALAPAATHVLDAEFARTWRRQVQPPSGKGFSRREAHDSALGEAIERYCGEFDGTEPYVTTSFRRLGASAIDPGACMLYSQSQYARRHESNGGDGRHAAPAPFDADQRLQWTAVRSLTQRTWRYLPSAYLYYGHPDGWTPGMCRADSNGCAAGPTKSRALLRGLLELIERDAVAIWWYNRVRRPTLPLRLLAGTRAEGFVRDIRRHGRDVWLLDLMTDLAIPVCGAISARTRRGARIAFGFAADLDPRRAAVRAMAELGQVLAAGDDDAIDPPHGQWLERATLHTDPYLVPANRPGARRAADLSRGLHTTNDAAAIRYIRRRLEARGLEVLALDQTRPDVRMPVMRAIVPGLRHFWPRFAPGRLYQVPVQLGWLDSPTRECDLNPVAFFL